MDDALSTTPALFQSQLNAPDTTKLDGFSTAAARFVPIDMDLRKDQASYPH